MAFDPFRMQMRKPRLQVVRSPNPSCRGQAQGSSSSGAGRIPIQKSSALRKVTKVSAII